MSRSSARSTSWPSTSPPEATAFCNGQILPIAQNTALFSLLGTTYGGNGQTTFALPDLRGRVALHPGQGPGLANYFLGQVGGSETHTMTTAQMPSHRHTATATDAAATSSHPANRFPARGGNWADTSDGTELNPGFVKKTGAGQPFPIRDPFLALNFVIALEGIFPSRN